MRPEDRDAAYLWDMLQAAQEVQSMLSDHSTSAFCANRMLTLAVERGIEIIGEAARRVSDSFQENHPQIPWRDIIGQRNILAHQYGRIDHELLYNTGKFDIPLLVTLLQGLLSELDSE